MLDRETKRSGLEALSSAPAGSWPRVLAAGSAAPGRVSASAGGAASLGSPAQMPAPARPAGRRRTPAAPRRHPHPAEATRWGVGGWFKVAKRFARFDCNLDRRSYLGQLRELRLELRENPQSQQANLRRWGEGRGGGRFQSWLKADYEQQRWI